MVVGDHCGVDELIVVFCSVCSVGQWVVDGCLVSLGGLSCEDCGILSFDDWLARLFVEVDRQGN